MGGHARSEVTLLMGLCLLCGWPDAPGSGQAPVAPVAAPDQAAQGREEYRNWVGQFSRTPLDGLKLVITAVEGEDKVGEGRPILGWGISGHGCRISLDGALSHFSFSDRGTKGSSGSKIDAGDLQRLDELLGKLPEDGACLPAAGRRVLIQAATGAQATVRVYDRANAPAEVLEVLRLSRSQIRSWLPEFKPQSEIDARPHQHDGFLCLSPDGTQIIFTGMNGPLQFWEPITHESLGEIRAAFSPLAGITFSPNASLAVISGWGTCALVETRNWRRLREFAEPTIDRRQHGLEHPRFTPDGKYLVLQCSEPSLRIFDTATWERVARLTDIPEDAVRYIPAPKKKRAVVRLKSGTVALWDLERHAAVAELDRGCSLTHAAFSPDEALLATVTHVKWDQGRIRLWKTDSGEVVHELRPFEQVICERILEPFWTPDGQYLLAATKAHSFFTSEGISVWNVKTGRHRGEFTGCPSHVNGVVLLPDGSQLVAGCTDGKIRFWDLPAAMKQIRNFENSLQSN
jgi:WD40 repeat protein